MMKKWPENDFSYYVVQSDYYNSIRCRTERLRAD